MIAMLLTCMLLVISISLLVVSEASSAMTASYEIKVAIMITIAGKRKLSDYFDWTCTSIERGKGMFDLLVFHEGNELVHEREKRGTCASNVKFINLGEDGLSELIGIPHSSMHSFIHLLLYNRPCVHKFTLQTH